MKAKRVFTLSALLAVVFILVVLIFGSTMGAKTAKAEEVANGATTEVLNEMGQDGEVESETETSPEETPTFFSRIGEWFSHNFLEFLSSVDLVAMAGCITAVILERKSNKKNSEETKTAIKANTDAMNGNTKSNDQVLDVVNLLIDKTNDLAASEEHRDTNIGQLLLLNKAVLEILVTVYVNNKNIPQATKDLVNLKFVAALKGTDKAEPVPEEQMEG